MQLGKSPVLLRVSPDTPQSKRDVESEWDEKSRNRERNVKDRSKRRSRAPPLKMGQTHKKRARKRNTCGGSARAREKKTKGEDLRILLLSLTQNDPISRSPHLCRRPSPFTTIFIISRCFDRLPKGLMQRRHASAADSNDRWKLRSERERKKEKMPPY
jgi:hypothetical protein